MNREQLLEIEAALLTSRIALIWYRAGRDDCDNERMQRILDKCKARVQRRRHKRFDASDGQEATQ